MSTSLHTTLGLIVATAAAVAGGVALAQEAPQVRVDGSEQGNLPDAPFTQSDIAEGRVGLARLQLEGLRMFTTSFNRFDGYGDGPMDPTDTRSPGGRPTLQGNGTFLRVNGLDAQSCLECHSIVSAASVPARLGIGGVGGSNANAIIKTTAIDTGDSDRDGHAGTDGRFANPPFVFGAGGIELLAKEMTADLQALAAEAVANPGALVDLRTKGISFGSLTADAEGVLDTSNVEGVDADLVVRPFGRKGEFATVRAFDLDALQFHMGMQPTEVVGAGVDPDGDGVLDEVSPAHVSALSIFVTTLERPVAKPPRGDAARGFATFVDAGCAECHVPSLETTGRKLPLAFPEVPTAPWQNVFHEIDLAAKPVRFGRNDDGGVTVPLFADLKRHDMGDGLAETFSAVSDKVNREFTTARLWGVADSAPYLHDGRATTLSDAILAHGGEAQDARDVFASLSGDQQAELLSFLRTLRTPKHPAARLSRMARRRF